MALSILSAVVPYATVRLDNFVARRVERAAVVMFNTSARVSTRTEIHLS